jgi:hypothetical protein
MTTHHPRVDLVSVAVLGHRYEAGCVCGWDAGKWFQVHGDAMAVALVHVREAGAC